MEKWLIKYGKTQVAPHNEYDEDYSFQSVNNGLFITAPLRYGLHLHTHTGTQKLSKTP
ncbi:hypothetical protein L218DRAFT_1010419 [Marasmius fiardii PR-910]|nr:hypothetical protein L218DRAFT_1010419 [Marasmius fiardii PR-910]